MTLYPGSSGDVFDIARSPLADFHFQERYRQGKLVKVSSNLDYDLLYHSGITLQLFLHVVSKSYLGRVTTQHKLDWQTGQWNCGHVHIFCHFE